MDEQMVHKVTKKKKKRKPRKRKNHLCKSYISNEELKVHPAFGDDAFHHSDRHFDNEETRAFALFIAEYHQTKVDQDFDNQSVLSDLDEEKYFGNTEYKLRLNQCTADRIVRLTTQMKFRLQEGKGEAFYVIGAGDKGEATGITTEVMESSLKNLNKMAWNLDAKLTVRSVNKGRVGEIVRVRVV
jgi:hypothetical protein